MSSQTTKLPLVREIQWIDSTDFSEKKVDVGSEVKNGNITRVQLMYKYGNGDNKNVLMLTIPREPAAYFRTNGVEEDSFVKKNGVKTMLGKNVMKLYLQEDNEYHTDFYNALVGICTSVKKKLDKKTKKNCNVKIKGLYNLINDDKEVTGHVLTTKIIESGNGTIFSSAYDDEEQLDILTIGKASVRPALIFGYIVPEEGNDYNISVSISQVYAVKKSLFPLRDRD